MGYAVFGMALNLGWWLYVAIAAERLRTILFWVVGIALARTALHYRSALAVAAELNNPDPDLLMILLLDLFATAFWAALAFGLNRGWRRLTGQ